MRMISKLLNIFKKKPVEAPKVKVEPKLQFIIEDPDPEWTEKTNLEQLKNQLDASLYFKQECRAELMSHLTHGVSLHKTGEVLTVKEKRALELNTRMKFSSGFIAVLTEEGLKLDNPKAALGAIYYASHIETSKLRTYIQAENAGVDKFELLSIETIDVKRCDWCRDNNGKIFSGNPRDIIEANCLCSPNTATSFTPQLF